MVSDYKKIKKDAQTLGKCRIVRCNLIGNRGDAVSIPGKSVYWVQPNFPVYEVPLRVDPNKSAGQVVLVIRDAVQRIADH